MVDVIIYNNANRQKTIGGRRILPGDNSLFEDVSDEFIEGLPRRVEVEEVEEAEEEQTSEEVQEETQSKEVN